jgi:putative CocE/NonD family hydrolase
MSGRPDPDPHCRTEVRDGMRITWHQPVEMDDGLVLRADVYRPIEDGRCPVILTYGIYAKGLAFQDGYPMQWEKMITDHPEILDGSTNKYQNWETTDPERWVPHGYAVVRVDSRGAGWSPGFMDPNSPREIADLAQCIEWAGTQPWSNGKVGMLGISYYASNQWRVAGEHPAHLAAIIPCEGRTTGTVTPTTTAASSASSRSAGPSSRWSTSSTGAATRRGRTRTRVNRWRGRSPCPTRSSRRTGSTPSRS